MVICCRDTGKFLEDVKALGINRNPFQTVAFYKNYFARFTDKKPEFFEVFDNAGTLIGVVPFELKSKAFGGREYIFAAHRKINYQEYICADEDFPLVHSELMAYFAAQKGATRIFYYDINEYSGMYKLLCEDERATKKTLLYDCPAVVLGKDFDEYFKSRVKEAKKRSEIRKFVKKLENIGNMRMINIQTAQAYSENESLIDDIFLVHKERFDGVYTPSHFSDIGLRDYYKSIIKDTVSCGSGFLSLLLLDSTVISFIYCLKNSNSLTDWIPAFDPAFSKYNLGTVHYYLLFSELCGSGEYEYFDFSKGDSVYKRRWANAQSANYSFMITVNANLISRTAGGAKNIFSSVKVVLRKKGVLKRIKRFMGRYIKEDAGTTTAAPQCEIKSVASCDTNFCYADIRYQPVDVRERILNALYSGKNVNIIKDRDDRTVVEVSE